MIKRERITAVSTSVLTFTVILAMLYLAGMQLKWIGLATLASSPVMYYMLWMVPFRRARETGAQK